jgi:hypothetical protein
MPWYAILYVLVLAALAIASWQYAERLPLVPAWLRNGDLLAAAGQILLTVGYFDPVLADTLGLVALPLLAGLVAWMIFAIAPAIVSARVAAASRGATTSDLQGYCGAALAFVLAAPAFYCGLQLVESAFAD